MWPKIIVIHRLYYVVSNPHELWNKDAKRKDTFELDSQNHRLIKKITVFMTNDYISCELVYGDFRVVAFTSILS